MFFSGRQRVFGQIETRKIRGDVQLEIFDLCDAIAKAVVPVVEALRVVAHFQFGGLVRLQRDGGGRFRLFRWRSQAGASFTARDKLS